MNESELYMSATDPYRWMVESFEYWLAINRQKREPTHLVTRLRGKTVTSSILLILQRCRISWSLSDRGHISTLAIHSVRLKPEGIEVKGRKWYLVVIRVFYIIWISKILIASPALFQPLQDVHFIARPHVNFNGINIVKILLLRPIPICEQWIRLSLHLIRV